MPPLSGPSPRAIPDPDELPPDELTPDELPHDETPPGSGGTESSSEREAATVRRSYAYCSATDRSVPVLVRPRARPHQRRPSYRDAEKVVCLDYGVRCTGFLCPLFDIPTLGRDQLTDPGLDRPS